MEEPPEEIPAPRAVISQFLSLSIMENNGRPFLARSAWKEALHVIAAEFAFEFVTALIENPLTFKKIANLYLRVQSVDLFDGGGTFHHYADLARMVLGGLAEEGYGTGLFPNRGRFINYEHENEDVLPQAIDRLVELDKHQKEASVFGPLLMTPSKTCKELTGYRFHRTTELTSQLVKERYLAHAFSKKGMTAPIPQGFFWVKEVPKWVKDLFGQKIFQSGPYLVASYLIKKSSTKSLIDPDLSEESFQDLRREALEVGAVSILLHEKELYGRDLLLRNLYYVEDREEHPKKRVHRWCTSRGTITSLNEGGRMTPLWGDRQMGTTLLGHGVFQMHQFKKSDAAPRFVDKNSTAYPFIHEEHYTNPYEVKCLYNDFVWDMNRIARLLRWDAQTMIERYAALGKSDYNDDQLINALANDLMDGQITILMALTGYSENMCRAFSCDGPFRWTHAAKQLLYWHSKERGALPKDLYDEGLDVRVDPQWTADKGPIPWLALEEQWYHASLIGLILSYKKA